MKSRLCAKRCTSYASSSLNLDGDTAADRIQPRAAKASDISSVRSEKCSLSDGFPPRSSAPAINITQMMCETCLLTYRAMRQTHMSVSWQAAIFTCYFTPSSITSFFFNYYANRCVKCISRVLPSGGAMLQYMFHVQLFLCQKCTPHREHYVVHTHTHTHTQTHTYMFHKSNNCRLTVEHEKGQNQNITEEWMT